jgi:hypothetical protein
VKPNKREDLLHKKEGDYSPINGRVITLLVSRNAIPHCIQNRQFAIENPFSLKYFKKNDNFQ